MSAATATATRAGEAGAAGRLLRHWRELRRMSQLQLSIEADVSQRHISWVETGRSQPSRDMLLHLADVLDLPLRDRNALLTAGGYAAAFPHGSWDDPEVAPLREAVETLLASHAPHPAVVLDRHWNLVDANDAAVALIGTYGGTRAMEVAEGNAMRLLVHPDGLRESIRNFDEVAGHLAHRITREAASYPDDTALAALAEEMLGHLGDVPPRPPDAPVPMVVTTHLERDGHSTSLVSLLATLGGALEVTLSELVVELFYPVSS